MLNFFDLNRINITEELISELEDQAKQFSQSAEQEKKEIESMKEETWRIEAGVSPAVW